MIKEVKEQSIFTWQISKRTNTFKKQRAAYKIEVLKRGKQVKEVKLTVAIWWRNRGGKWKARQVRS